MPMIQYAVTYATHQVTDAEYDLVWGLYNPQHGRESQRVVAIKFIRCQYGLSLKTAKDICDAIGAQQRIVNSI